ncbi:MAG: Nif3-like dinuclear metal center hexameric protein [Clostridiales bacterium]|nr:MAG: Nif3-like dinuclear metal center hexameric protein [Clostridiales bacterium]
MNTGDIYSFINTFAPFDTAEKWDNVGLLVGNSDNLITKVLISLDITPAVVFEAYEKGAELIVSHHPVIFDPLKNLVPNSAPYLLAKYGIDAICAHTNLDIAENGVNDVLAKAAGIKDRPELLIEKGKQAIGRIGFLENDMLFDDYVCFIKNVLNSNIVRYSKSSSSVCKVAVVGGAGDDYIELAREAGADTFLTGDVKYHDFLLANELGMNLIDAGHFSTENLIITYLKEKFENEFPQTIFIVSEHKDIIKGM